MISTARFTPRRMLLIVILIPLILFVALSIFNRVAYTGIMVRTTTAPEGVSFDGNTIFITTSRFSQATRFGVYVTNTSPRILATITIHVRLLNDEGTVVGSSEGQGTNIQPEGGQWIRGDFEVRRPYTQADYDVTSIEWR